MNMILAIALGGGLGSVTRHYAIGATNGISGDPFPYGTLLVNVLGSFIIGALMEAMALKWQVTLETRAFLVTGFLGGFTTFSSFSWETWKLVEDGRLVMAMTNILASVVICLVATFAGAMLAKQF